MSAVIDTPRLRLRPLEMADAEVIAREIAQWDVIRWLTAPPHPYRLEDARDFIAMVTAENAEGHHWAITEAGRFLGIISADEEFGYWLSREAQGRGIMTEAGDAVLDWVFTRTETRRLESGTLDGNLPSQNTLAKLGFTHVGRVLRVSKALEGPVEGPLMELTRADWHRNRTFAIETPRLRLRELLDADWPALQRVAGQEAVARNMFSITVPWPEEAVRAYIAKSRFRGRLGFRAAILLEDRLIGTVGIGPAPSGGPNTMGWYIDPDLWGHGYATEAARALIAFAYARFPQLGTIWTDHFADNPASGAVMRKLGFAPTGKTVQGTSAARLEPAPCIVYRLERPAPEAQS